ncbi:MAG: hypothetical protein JEZ11_09460 [Desulfobacterales bacterium]|nr:hypothetical protein [Desulfobacterales bacterium]
MKKGTESAVVRVVVATGVASVATQLVTIREYLAQFQGNEFVIALILFNWLILGGFGTLAARGAMGLKMPASASCLGWISMALAAFPAIQIHAIRGLRDTVFVLGSSVGFYQTLGFTFLTLAPYGLMVGFVLPYSLFVLRKRHPTFSGARIYIADNLGDAAGGALFAFVLVHLVTPLQAVSVAGLPLIAAALGLFHRQGRMGAGAVIGALAAVGVLAAGIGFESASLAPASGVLAHYRESRHGRLVIHRDGEQVTLFEDGSPVSSSHHPALAEEAVHYPLAQVDRPRRVLVISAEGGMMAELAKYQLDAVDYVELNPDVTELLFRYGMIRPISGLRVIHQDARAFLAGTDSSYDAILVNLAEPSTFQVNRFFTGRFHELAQAHLAPGGVLSFAMDGFDNYLAEPQRQALSSLFNTAASHFKEVLLLPGERTWFLCADHRLTTDIPARLAARGIETRYVSRYFYGNMTGERVDRLNGLMDRTTPVNLDRTPYLMRLMFDQWFAKFDASPTVFIGLLGIFALVYLMTLRREAFVLFSTGFATMGVEFLVIFAFQIYYGYIYLQIGLIVTVFLAGLLPGAWIGERFCHRGKSLMIMTDVLLIGLLGLVILAIHVVGDSLPVAFFLVFGFAVSMTCGCQFPVALYRIGGDGVAASKSFSADLMGAAVGSLVTSVVMMPYFGLVGTAMGLMAVKLVSLFLIGSKT